MLRTIFLFVCLLGFIAGTDAVAARLPKGRIMPGNHRPVYKRYGHHGLFDRGGLFDSSRSKMKARPAGSSRLIKKRRGTL